MTASGSNFLNTLDHSRTSAGLTYVYPVISRRAGGVSVGINLNTNNACNWACVYCQVPDLARGGPLPVDLALLEQELRSFLNVAVNGDFMAQQVPPEARQLMDIAFSGNGEPTSASEFLAAVDIAVQILSEFGLLESMKIRLITNGSLLQRQEVQDGIRRIGELHGEVWFKLDSATTEGMRRINGINLAPEAVLKNLEKCSGLAPTWLQTCFFSMDGKTPDEAEQQAYLELVAQVKNRIRGVHLYGLARQSMQQDAQRLAPACAETLAAFAAAIESQGVEVRIAV